MNYEKSGIGYKVKRNQDEVDESYKRRKWFIGEITPKTKKEYEEAIKLSNIWINMKYLGCRYPTEAEKKVENILKGSSMNNKTFRIKVV